MPIAQFTATVHDSVEYFNHAAWHGARFIEAKAKVQSIAKKIVYTEPIEEPVT